MFLFFKDFTTSKHIAGMGSVFRFQFHFFLKISILNKGNIAGVGVSEQVESGDRWRVRFLPTAPTLVLVLTSPQLGLSTCVSNRGALDGGRYQQDTNTNTKTNTTISDQSPKIPTTVSGYPINTSVSNRLHSKEENIRSLVTL